MLVHRTSEHPDARRDDAGAGAAGDAREAQAALRVQRGLAELRAGRPIVLGGPADAGSADGRPVRRAVRLLAIEALDAADLDDFADEGGRLHGWLARGRAEALDPALAPVSAPVSAPASAPASLSTTVPASGSTSAPSPSPEQERAAGVVAFTLAARELAPEAALAGLRALAGLDTPATGAELDAGLPVDFRAVPGSLPAAAIELARRSSLLPALLHAPATPRDGATGAASPAVEPLGVDDVLAYAGTRGRLLARASTARVPLPGAGLCEFTVYRERYGESEHVAVVVGEPDRGRPVIVRIHSACFTGDIFGSMKCDCGEQLRGAVARLAADGGGVILYLAQEGRGIGLANKLRAYALQETGLDTIDADRRLGFESDHRDFTVARTMLVDLGIGRVRLVTNNPRKIAALEAGGIEVVERIPSVASINPHNASYLETKRDRAGHLLRAVGAVAVGE